MEAVASKYKGKVEFLFVYCREAHAADSPGLKGKTKGLIGKTKGGKPIPQAQTPDDRKQMAQQFCDDMKSKRSILIDSFGQDRVQAAYGQLANPTVVIDIDGIMALKMPWTDGQELDRFLEPFLKSGGKYDAELTKSVKFKLRGRPKKDSPSKEPLPGFKLDGTNWTYKDDQLSLAGILLKPDGKGPFPAILISHGGGGTAEGFGMPKAREFVKMGFVCIAPNYTHAGKGFDKKQAGASTENLKRAVKCLDILASLPEVDAERLCAYGNSMGAFVTIRLAAEAPERLKAAAFTAGGVGFGGATEEVATKVRTPFCILQGSSDNVTRPERSTAFKDILDKNKVANERHVFEGVGHGLHQEKAAECYKLMKAWFENQGVLKQ